MINHPDLFPKESKQTIIEGDCLHVMKSMESESITHVLTDPPYGLKFMGKEWDKGIPGIEFWQEALRICKPGSMMLCFGGTRTYHRLACAIEDAGWEIRDCLMWVYGSGFPKSHNHFGYEGYGTALKPAYEPIVMAMKPLDGTFANNGEKHGVSGINIDECRIGTDQVITQLRDRSCWHGNKYGNFGYEKPIGESEPRTGRWPANILFDEQAAQLLDEQSGILSKGHAPKLSKSNPFGGYNDSPHEEKYYESGGASRFFYCAKASSSERDKGLDRMLIKKTSGGGGLNNTEDDVCGKYGSIKAPKRNHHPTVKPLKLMEYLLKLITPPKNGLILDPFMGSGTTLLAAKNLDINAIGIELNKEYCNIAKGRLGHDS